MSRYAATCEIREGLKVIVLTDAACKATAELLPAAGNNLYRFESKGHPVIMPPASLRSLKNEPFEAFKYGTPILFPPNRVKQGRFSFRGRQYNLPLNEPPGNHLHGEISSRSWEVIEQGASDHGGATVTSRFHYGLHPEMLEYFPHPLSFTVTYRLFEGRLMMDTKIRNDGEDEAPFAFGLHPYFSIPFKSGEQLALKVPAASEWPVTNEAFVMGTPAVTPFSQALKEGASMTDYPRLGCSLLALEDEEADHTCRIEMKDSGYAITYRFDRKFPFLVLFRPDWAEAYSLEPYTSVTDAFNLPYGHELTGARGIGAGEEIRFATSLAVEALV
ncbi:aldose 1-epimerase [Paenibacillus sp. LPE1-1-1.1]|uniref:aldose 1-epimerase n=1 Tax=Paenibacillus sp. LPE1-1-1.1 TaxID=3135230 RepID=UPI00343A685C